MPSVSINPPKTPVTKGSNGIATATIPNVCKMPGPPAPFVPAPLPNIGKSGDSPQGYSQDVTIEGKAVAIKGATFNSIGDMASKGTGGGLISANTHGITKFVGPGSMDVKIEGKNVQLLSDPMLNNCAGGGSPPNSATLLGVVQDATNLIVVESQKCKICEKEHEMKESDATKADAESLASNFDPRIKTPAVKQARSGAPVQTMLGVVHCKCGNKKYADQSGMTTKELCQAASQSGMKHPNGVTVSYADGADALRDYEDQTNRVKQAMAKHVGQDMRFKIMWSLANGRFGQSLEAMKQGRVASAAYPPGECAAQKALVLTLDAGGLPVAMTERFHSSKGAKGLTGAPIKHILVTVQDGVTARSVEDPGRKFKHGETVPPCQTCELLVPLLICPKDETQCNHSR